MSQVIERRGGASVAGTAPSTAQGGVGSRVVRPLLMLGGVAVLAAVALVLWLRGGRIVSIDDAYLRAAKVAVSTDVSGIVAAVDVHEGQVVHRGDVLFRLDQRPFRIAVEGARAALAQTTLDVAAMKQDYQRAQRDVLVSQAQVQSDQADYARFAPLVHDGAATGAETDAARYKLAADRQRLESLRTQVQMLLARLTGDADIAPERTPSAQQARARLDEAQRQLDHATVRAPFDGIATQVETVQPGMYMGAATPAFALVSTTNIWAEGNPKETELTWVIPGQRVDVHVDTYPDRACSGVVESIAPASGSEFSVLPAQNTSGNWIKVVQRIPLRVKLDPARCQGPQGALRAGMSAVLDIDTGHRRRLPDLLP